MAVAMLWTVVVGIGAAGPPSEDLRALAKQVSLPAGAADKWDAIGTYTLKGRKVPTTVKLYYSDSDSIADKVARARGRRFGTKTYPNFFSIHAVYREGDGPWKHKELYGGPRVGFSKVAEVKPEAVTIQLRSKLKLIINRRIRWSDEDLKRLSTPISTRLSLKDGVPSLN
jgi:hypothetical protein